MSAAAALRRRMVHAPPGEAPCMALERPQPRHAGQRREVWGASAQRSDRRGGHEGRFLGPEEMAIMPVSASDADLEQQLRGEIEDSAASACAMKSAGGSSPPTPMQPTHPTPLASSVHPVSTVSCGKHGGATRPLL
jgi:hypothetical protein